MATRAIIEFKEVGIYADLGGKVLMVNDGNPENVARLLKKALATREKVFSGSFRNAISLHFINADVLELAAMGYQGRCVPLRDGVVDMDQSHDYIVNMADETVKLNGTKLTLDAFLALASE